MVEQRGETWRPPLFLQPRTLRARRAAALRRLLDLPAASIWRDLETELPRVRGVLLDVGCGAQPYRPLIPRDVRYVGIDTAGAKGAFGYEVPNTIYFEGERWPVENGSVDVVLATETLEHVLEPARFLAEAARCLRPGGTILLTVPFAARWHFVPRDYWRFTPSGLEHLLVGAGFDQIGVYARGNALTVACYKAMALALPWLMPQRPDAAGQLRRLLALPTVPLIGVAALIGQLSLRSAGGDDCLGYTAIARRAS